MNTVKQFINYFNAALRSPRHRRLQIFFFFFFYILLFNGVIFATTLSLNFYTGFLAFIAELAFLAAVVMNGHHLCRPNLVSQMPIGTNKSLAFRFLAALALFVCFVLAIFLFFFACWAITAIFALMVGETPPYDFWIIYDEFDHYSRIGMYGGLFSAGYFVIMYSAGMLSGFFKRRAHRNIFLACFAAALFFILLFYSVPHSEVIASGSPFTEHCFLTMAYPEVAITVWLVIAAAMLGCTVYMGVKRYKTKY